MTGRWAALALALAVAGCRPSPPSLADYVPAGATLIAGARLDALRASPLDSRLPQSFVEPYRDASTLWVVFNGAGLLTLAQSGREVKLSGSQALVQAAEAQRRSGKPGSPDLVAQAAAASAGHALWIAARGRVALPLTGDAANLNRLLENADFATLGLRLDPPARLDFTAQCPTPEQAQHLEESLRGLLSLSVLGLKHQPRLAALLRTADVRREGREVRASLTASGEDLPQLFDWFGR